jgi:hypothetical protein
MTTASILIEYLSSPASIRLADPSAHDYAAFFEATEIFARLCDDGDDPTTHLGKHFGLTKSQHTDFTGEIEKTSEMRFMRIVAAIHERDLWTIQRGHRIGKKIGEPVRDRLRDNEVLRPRLYRNKGELYALTKRNAETQGKILDLIEAGKADCVAEAEERLKLTPPGLPKWEREYRALDRYWAKSDLKARLAKLRDMRASGELDRLLERLDAEDGTPAAEAQPRIANYASASDLAAAKLPGLPQTKKGVLHLAETSGWRTTEIKVRGGTAKLFAVDDLPVAAVRELKRRRSLMYARAGAMKSPDVDIRHGVIPTVREGA